MDRRSVPSSLDVTSAQSEHGKPPRKSSQQTVAAGFAWVVVEPPTGARWDYSFVAVDGGTEVTETWELPPEGSAFFEKMFGDDAAKEIGIRRDWAKDGIGTRWLPSRVQPPSSEIDAARQRPVGSGH